MATSNVHIDLYTAGTPNGQKASITLEEIGLPYAVHKINLATNEQKEEWYLAINPNGRIPAIVDRTTDPPTRVFESFALMQYLCDRYDKDRKLSFEYDSPEYWESFQWNVWMNSGLGPMQGQANHFYRYAPEKIEYGVKRYQTETKRLYQVLEDRLAWQEAAGKGLWLVGGRFSLADLNCFGWVNWAEWAGVSLEPFPKLKVWLETISERPGVKRGLDVPEPFEMKKAMKTKEGEDEYAKHHSNWVMQGQNADQKKHSK